jgi:septum formation protein
MKLNGYEIILGSSSPRRHEYLKELGIPFRVEVHSQNETYNNDMGPIEIASHIAKLKSKPFIKNLKVKHIVITADTIVWNKGVCLGKPKDRTEAIKMLKNISNSKHQVITAVGFLTSLGYESINQTTTVKFKKLNEEDIIKYIESYNPFDKAGGYGIQDWIGLIGVDEIKGSYTNIVGLPVSEVYIKLKEIVSR